MQPGAHVGQRDVDDRDVEDDHELREQDDEQGAPPVEDGRRAWMRFSKPIAEFTMVSVRQLHIQVQERRLSW